MLILAPQIRSQLIQHQRRRYTAILKHSRTAREPVAKEETLEETWELLVYKIERVQQLVPAAQFRGENKRIDQKRSRNAFVYEGGGCHGQVFRMKH